MTRHLLRHCEGCDKNIVGNWNRHLKSSKHKTSLGEPKEKVDKNTQNFFITFKSKMKNLIANEMIGPKWKIFCKQYIQSFIVSDGHRNSYMVLKLNKKMKYKDIQRNLEDMFGFRADIIQSCRNVKNSVQYCSKKDLKCLVAGFDMEWLDMKTMACMSAEKNQYRPLLP